jgi:hypothetical protein
VLVRYDERREDNEEIQPRAYWLNRNHEPVNNPHKPHFVPVLTAQGLTPIPVICSSSTEASSQSGLYAVVSTNGQDFTLRWEQKEIGAYELPVYQDGSGRVKQLLLTPPAVVADVTIIGGVIGVLYLPYWWESLNCVTR